MGLAPRSPITDTVPFPRKPHLKLPILILDLLKLVLERALLLRRLLGVLLQLRNAVISGLELLVHVFLGKNMAVRIDDFLDGTLSVVGTGGPSPRFCTRLPPPNRNGPKAPRGGGGGGIGGGFREGRWGGGGTGSRYLPLPSLWGES